MTVERTILPAGTTDTSLIGGSANTADGSLYIIGVTRDGQGHINGFVGSATLYGSAPYNDGGLTYGPDGVLFASQWPVDRDDTAGSTAHLPAIHPAFRWLISGLRS